MSRPSRERIHMSTAYLWGLRSTCKRPNRKIGAVITTGDMTQILAIGYNGPAKGLPNDYCRGSKEIGTCGCLHAEMNAIAKVDSTITDKVLFVTMSPCEMCASLIAQANIKKVWYLHDYRNSDGQKILYECGIMFALISVKDLLLPKEIVYEPTLFGQLDELCH